MILRLASILSTMCLLYAATGCGESPKPIPLGSESTKPTASSPSSAVPSLPPEARQKNEAGVKATVEAFVAAWNLAAGTGDTRPLTALSMAECKKCSAAAETARETYAAGGRYENSQWKIGMFTLKGIQDNVAYVELLIDTSPNTYLPSASASPQHFPGSTNYPHFLRLEWLRSGQWQVLALDPRPNE